MAAANPATDAARLAVLQARQDLLGEVDRLEASARAAVDIKAKVRRSPGRAAAVAGGTAFLVLGGPKRLFRGVRRVVRGPAAAYPSKMLPDEVDRVVRSLGDDGDAVRGVLEREFAAFVTEKKRADRRFWRNALFFGVVAPAANAAFKLGTKWLLDPDPQRFEEWQQRIRERAGGGRSSSAPPDQGGGSR
jgi:hypothetical protein